MKNKVVFFIILLAFVTGCAEQDNILKLSIYNRTDSSLRIVSNIHSELYKSEKTFDMNAGDIVVLADKIFYVYSRTPIEKIIENNSDAFVRLYKKHGDEYSLMKEWTFKSRYNRERNIFNEQFLYTESQKTRKNKVENLIFTILPEDLEGAEEAP